ncbi:MAG: D-2-hydroxyacid dehydrogenase [Candidatus Aenigmarchaeota archaeon]|nr:D-2-hydroxyacid dehydrogenase [Candidatus Aenigmarchaeota archaeon]
MKVSVRRKISSENLKKIKKCGFGIGGYDAEVALVEGRFSDFRRYRNLKWIHTSFVGVDNLLTDEIMGSDVIITNSRGMKTPVPEHAMALMLSFERRLNEAFASQAKRKWDRIVGGELAGKTIFILGLGAIGLELAGLCRAFNCNVMGINNEPVKSRFVDKIGMSNKLHQMLPEADYVIACLPLTRETHHLLGRKEFSMMKKTAVVVNVGRGPVIDESALIAALRKKQIAGACLDVFEEEPLPKSSPLWKMKNVIITAHCASRTPHYEDRMIEIFCGNLRAFKSGRKLANVVDKERGY